MEFSFEIFVSLVKNMNCLVDSVLTGKECYVGKVYIHTGDWFFGKHCILVLELTRNINSRSIVFFFSYQCKNNKKLYRMQLVSYICYTMHLLLLGAITGGSSYMLNLVRSFCLSSDNEFLKSRKTCCILCAL